MHGPVPKVPFQCTLLIAALRQFCTRHGSSVQKRAAVAGHCLVLQCLFRDSMLVWYSSEPRLQFAAWCLNVCGGSCFVRWLGMQDHSCQLYLYQAYRSRISCTQHSCTHAQAEPRKVTRNMSQHPAGRVVSWPVSLGRMVMHVRYGRGTLAVQSVRALDWVA